MTNNADELFGRQAQKKLKKSRTQACAGNTNLHSLSAFNIIQHGVQTRSTSLIQHPAENVE